jgi:hypothetical protein
MVKHLGGGSFLGLEKWTYANPTLFECKLVELLWGSACQEELSLAIPKPKYHFLWCLCTIELQ